MPKPRAGVKLCPWVGDGGLGLDASGGSILAKKKTGVARVSPFGAQFGKPVHAFFQLAFEPAFDRGV